MYRYGKYNEKKYISKLNGTFVVSNALAGYLNKGINLVISNIMLFRVH